MPNYTRSVSESILSKVYGACVSLRTDDGYCHATNEGLQAYTGVGMASVRAALDILCKRGHILRTVRYVSFKGRPNAIRSIQPVTAFEPGCYIVGGHWIRIEHNSQYWFAFRFLALLPSGVEEWDGSIQPYDYIVEEYNPKPVPAAYRVVETYCRTEVVEDLFEGWLDWDPDMPADGEVVKGMYKDSEVDNLLYLRIGSGRWSRNGVTILPPPLWASYGN